jgi:hypothetical protein
MNDGKERPNEAGYTQAARWLTRMYGRPVTKQNVWIWWNRRDHNGFPKGVMTKTPHGYVRKFILNEVETWYEEQYGVEKLAQTHPA